MQTYLTNLTDYLLNQSWQIAILFLLVLAISFALTKKTSHLRYLLWLLILAKCLVPSLLTVSLAVLPQKQKTIATEQLLPSPVVSAETVELESVFLPEIVAEDQSIMDRLTAVSAKTWAAFTWLTGLSIFLLAIVTRAVRFSVYLARMKKPSGPFQTEIDRLRPNFAGSAKTKVWLLEGIGQPFVWGLWRGGIYLPTDFSDHGNIDHRRKILAHEFAHIARLDAFINTLQVIAQTIFWFHPLIWWANKKIRAEREKCCDETVIAKLNSSPKDYGSAIVDTLMAEYQSNQRIPSLAVAGPAKNIEDRIKTIMKPGKKFQKKPTLIALITILFIAAIITPTTIALTQRKTDSEDVKEAKRQQLREEKLKEALEHPEIITKAAQQLFDKIKNAKYKRILKYYNYNKGKWKRDGWKKFPTWNYYRVARNYPGFAHWMCEMLKDNPIASVELGEVFVIEKAKMPYAKVDRPAVPYKVTLKDGTLLQGRVPFEYTTQYPVAPHWHAIGGIDWHLQSNQKPDGKVEKSKVEPDIDFDSRIRSAKSLSKLATMLTVYASDHEDNYPENLEQLKTYDMPGLTETAIDDIKYLAKGKAATAPAKTVLAYDRVLLEAEKGKGTNVLFNDCIVEFVKSSQFEKLGIEIKSIVKIEARFLSVSADFLDRISKEKDFSFDPNKPFFIDDSGLDFIIKATQTHKDAKSLASPTITVHDGETATIMTKTVTDYISGYHEPNEPSQKPEPEHDTVETGIELKVTPKITADNKYILLKIDFNFSEVTGFNKHLYKDKYEYEEPWIRKRKISSRVVLRKGQTIVIGRYFSAGIDQTKTDSEPPLRELLILVKASIIEPGAP